MHFPLTLSILPFVQIRSLLVMILLGVENSGKDPEVVVDMLHLLRVSHNNSVFELCSGCIRSISPFSSGKSVQDTREWLDGLHKHLPVADLGGGGGLGGQNPWNFKKLLQIG